MTGTEALKMGEKKMEQASQEEWKAIEPGVWKPDQKEDSINGLLINKEPKTNDLGARYSIENVNGTFLVWGSAILDDRMQYVKVGSKVRITYKGKTSNKKGQDVNLFKVEVAIPSLTPTVQTEPAS